MDDDIKSNVLKFADDTKVFRKVNNTKWQMLFNFGICKCLQTGQGNTDVNNKMGDTVLGTTHTLYCKRKGLCSNNADIKVSEQYGISASKDNQILGLIRRNITYKEKN